MKKFKVGVVSLVAVSALLVTGCSANGGDTPNGGSAEDVTTLIVGHTGSPGGSINDFFELFAKKLDEQAGGALVAEVHPAGELGGDQQLLEALRIGSVGMASVATSNMAKYTPTFNFADLPYVFPDYESADRLWQSDLRDELDEQVNTTVGTHVLAYVNAGGYRVLANAERAVDSLTEMNGLKLRTTDAPLEAALTRAWGSNPVPVPWADTFSSVQQGIVDGLQLQPEWLNLNGFSAAVSHVTEVNALMAFHVVQVSDQVWSSLSPEEQALLGSVAEEAAAEANDRMMSDYTSHLEKLAADGVDVRSLSEGALEEFRKAALTTWDDFEDKELLDRVQRAQSS